ncbi:MAG: SHOCT domain-containing protein, partial [Burkholderiaceae bacterium]|nr:SHOCT domain-containing protein [Burkholderiaceae bacterium]
AKTAPTSQPTSASQPPSGLAEQLAKLNDLHQQGALSDDEYQAAKAKLL